MSIPVEFETLTEPFSFRFTERSESFEAEFRDLYFTRGAAYEGPYEVTPSVEAQVLETREKVMEEDIRIRSIPFFSVSNTAGGETVYIGSEC